MPLGVRFGYLFDRRFFLDVHCTLAYQIGGGNSLFDEPAFPSTRVISPILVELAVGIGGRGNKYRELR